MIWSKECINFSNDDLAELNRWAELHAKNGCEIMKLVLADKVPTTYISRVSDKIVVSRGISCPCGATYFCGEMESQDLWAEEDLF